MTGGGCLTRPLQGTGAPETRNGVWSCSVPGSETMGDLAPAALCAQFSPLTSESLVPQRLQVSLRASICMCSYENVCWVSWKTRQKFWLCPVSWRHKLIFKLGFRYQEKEPGLGPGPTLTLWLCALQQTPSGDHICKTHLISSIHQTWEQRLPNLLAPGTGTLSMHSCNPMVSVEEKPT